MSTVSGKAYVRENGPKDWSAIPRGDSYLFLYWCPEKWLDLTTSHDRVQKLPFFCLSLVKFNQVHIACSSYRNQTLLKDNFKKFWFATLWVAFSFYWYLCWFFCSRFYFHTLVICTMVDLEPNFENDPNANMVAWDLKTNSVRSKTYDFQFILLENHTLSSGERNSE